MHTKKKKYALRYLDIILPVLFAAFVCVITTSKIIEDDVFIHLVAGKYIVENKSIPSVDMFGFVTEGTPWVTYEWAWQAITFLLWKAGDYTLLSVFRTLIIIFIFLVFYLLFKKIKAPIPLFILLGILMCIGMAGRLVIRPQIISYLFLSLLVSSLFYYKYFGLINKKYLLLLPFVFLLWANMHMGVILGIVVFALFLFSETIKYTGRKGYFKNSSGIFSFDELRTFYAVFLISTAAVLINPQFTGTFIFVYNMLTMPELYYINEWASPFDGRYISGYYVSIYFIFLFLGIAILYYSYKTKEIYPAILYVVVGIFSMKSLRYTSDFMLVIFVPLVISINYILKCSRLKTNYFNNPVIKLSACTALIFLIVNTYNNEVYKMLNVPFKETGFGVSQKYYPTAMFGFIEKNRISDIGNRPFNSMRIGGYFLWSFEGKKNFADNRCLNSNILNEYMDISLVRNDFEEKLKKYDIDYVILNIPDINTIPFEIQFNLAGYLLKNPVWKIIYWDDKSFLFVRNEKKFCDLISKFEYKYLTPSNCLFHKNVIIDALKTDSKRLLNETNRKITEDKNGVIINDIISYINIFRIASINGK